MSSYCDHWLPITSAMMHNLMQTKHETRVRVLARTKGLELVQVNSQSASTTGESRYKVVAMGGTNIFPPGMDDEGVLLTEAEDWLNQPWE